MIFHIYTCILYLLQEHYKLTMWRAPRCLIAQLHVVEHCTGIAEVMGLNPVQAWIFSGFKFHNWLSCVYNCDDQWRLHVFLRSSNIWSFIYSFAWTNFIGKWQNILPVHHCLIGVSSICFLIAPQGFGPEAKTRGGIIVSPAYTYKECVKYWCSMRINPDLMKLGAHGGPG